MAEYEYPCAPCQCNRCANNVENAKTEAGEMSGFCFSCDECRYYDGNPDLPGKCITGCPDYKITNYHAQEIRKKWRISDGDGRWEKIKKFSQKETNDNGK